MIISDVNRAIYREAGLLKIPMVCMGDDEYLSACPRVTTDHAAVARLAAEHLLERGFKQFGYCGCPLALWSLPRQEQFERSIRARGYACSVCNIAWKAGDIGRVLERWLVALPKPAGIMTSDDLRGQEVLQACRRRGILVPDEIAVIAANSGSDSYSEISDPPMSIIVLNAYREGYEAAAMLDTLMSGKKLETKVRLIGPIGIQARQSTDVLAIDDRNIASALRYIRENACKGIDVGDVLKAVPQSRKMLEYRFQKLIGRTPHEELLRVRLARAKMLLSESDLSQEQIAERTGFNQVGYFSAVFHQNTGVTPGQYRRLNLHRA